MTDMTDTTDTTDFIVEPCEEINEIDQTEVRSSFRGLIKDAPNATSTSIVNGLSQQLIYQLQLTMPNAFVSFDDLNVNLLDAAFPFVQPPAKQALQKAIQDRGIPMRVNSCYRTIAQQMLLYNDRHRNSNPVAKPGASNHQTGLAIDIQDPRGWEPFLERYGWRALRGDPPHFDFRGGGTVDIRSKAIVAFQQLWNQNNPNDKIGEDGSFGPKTENALNRSPAQGFAKAPWDRVPRPLRLTTPRLEGSDVLRLQEALKKGGAAITVDGEFGPGTDQAVKQFQQQKGLTADGIVGPKTLEMMS